jgi:hypothetical protein
MAGLVPAIHVLMKARQKTWMPATSAGMTPESAVRMAKNNPFVPANAGTQHHMKFPSCIALDPAFAGMNGKMQRHGRTCSGHPRLDESPSEDVDARDKRGHDRCNMTAERGAHEKKIRLSRARGDPRATSDTALP